MEVSKVQNKLKKLALLSGFVLFVGLLSINLGPKDANAYLTNPALGQLDVERNAEYLFVYNEDNVAHEVGDVVIYVSTATSGIRGLSITTTTTQGDAQVAGVVVNTDIAATSWGKIQTRGFCPAVNITGSSTVGALLTTSTTGELAVSTGPSSTAYIPGVFGVAITAESDGIIPAFLK